MARPREFCVDKALERALDAFWVNGYEATSVCDLMEAMDLQKGSLYKAFGDKHSLYMSALEQYIRQSHEFDQQTLEDAATPKEAVTKWLNRDIKKKCNDSLRRGCFVVNALTELAYKDEQVATAIKNHISGMTRLLTTTIQQGQEEGEFRSDVSASGIAQILVTHLFGLATLGKAVTTKSASLQGIKNILTLIEQPGN